VLDYFLGSYGYFLCHPLLSLVGNGKIILHAEVFFFPHLCNYFLLPQYLCEIFFYTFLAVISFTMFSIGSCKLLLCLKTCIQPLITFLNVVLPMFDF
jgi:hypothetical protein